MKKKVQNQDFYIAIGIRAFSDPLNCLTHGICICIWMVAQNMLHSYEGKLGIHKVQANHIFNKRVSPSIYLDIFL